MFGLTPTNVAPPGLANFTPGPFQGLASLATRPGPSGADNIFHYLELGTNCHTPSSPVFVVGPRYGSPFQKTDICGVARGSFRGDRGGLGYYQLYDS